MDYKNINDYEQLYLISENDDIAKELMFNKYRPIILSIANKHYTKLINRRIDLEDLVQEGYIGLFSAMNCFSEKANACFYTFCMICIDRQIRSYCRKYTSPKNEIINTSYSIDLHNDTKDLINIDEKDDELSIRNPEVYFSNNLLYEKLISFKNELPIQESLVFELRCNGFKYKEIAKLLDISISRVDNCIHIFKEKFTNIVDK